MFFRGYLYIYVFFIFYFDNKKVTYISKKSALMNNSSPASEISRNKFNCKIAAKIAVKNPVDFVSRVSIKKESSVLIFNFLLFLNDYSDKKNLSFLSCLNRSALLLMRYQLNLNCYKTVRYFLFSFLRKQKLKFLRLKKVMKA